jgi:hypothetical protein
MDGKFCAICLKNVAITECDGCLRPLCKRCRSMEIWHSPHDEDVTVKSFCSQCKDNPEINPYGKGEKVFGLGEVTDMVNHEQGKLSGFKFKLKMD